MPAEQRVIREDHSIPKPHVVSEMGTGHEEAIAPNHGRAAVGGPPVHRAILANPIAIAEFHEAIYLGLEGEILRIPADDRTVADHVLLPHPDIGADDGVRLDHTPIAYLSRAFDDRVRPDGDVGSEPGVGMNYSGRVNHRGAMNAKTPARGKPALARQRAPAGQIKPASRKEK